MAKDKKKRQRAVIFLTDTDSGNFDVDCTFEPSIRHNPEAERSASVRVARETLKFILANFRKPEIIITDKR